MNNISYFFYFLALTLWNQTIIKMNFCTAVYPSIMYSFMVICRWQRSYNKKNIEMVCPPCKRGEKLQLCSRPNQAYHHQQDRGWHWNEQTHGRYLPIWHQFHHHQRETLWLLKSLDLKIWIKQSSIGQLRGSKVSFVKIGLGIA